MKTDLSKREAISMLDQVGEFARQASVLFSDLRSRCNLIGKDIRLKFNDPLTTEQVDVIERLIDTWEVEAKRVMNFKLKEEA